MLTFNVITLIPSLFKDHLENLPFKRAILNKAIQVNLINLRDFAIDKRGTVDGKPFGGGTGMILMLEPIYKALHKVVLGSDTIDVNENNINQLLKHIKQNKDLGKRVVLLSPKGERFTQKKAEELSKCSEITFICGRYEGVDARVEEFVTDIISIGDYVLSGGELAALVVMESITRLLPGTLEKEDAAKIESFSEETGGKLEYPQYTRPENFAGLVVPQVLLSGNHKEIEDWRKNN